MSTTTLVAGHNPGRRPPRGSRPDGNAPRGFRLRRPPSLEPPFDDERDLNEVLGNWSPGHGHSRADFAERPRPILAAPSGEAAHAASRYVQVCLEVLNGFRPPSHLRTLSGPIEFADVLRHLRLRRNGIWRGGESEKPQPGGPASTLPASPTPARPAQPSRNQRLDLAYGPAKPTAATTAPMRGPFRPVTPPLPHGPQLHAAFRLLRIRVSEPLPDKAEVVAVVAYADVSLAIAMRLEVRNSAWVCTVFQVI
jgi:hypothetical protein